MGNFFYYQQNEPDVIIQLNSMSPTTRKFEYVVEKYPTDDDEPTLNMYKFYNKTRYNH